MQRCQVNVTIKNGKYYGLNESGNLGLDWMDVNNVIKTALSQNTIQLIITGHSENDVISSGMSSCGPVLHMIATHMFFPMTTLCGQGSRGNPRYQETWSWHT